MEPLRRQAGLAKASSSRVKKRINKAVYGKLLLNTLPAAIESDEDNERMLDKAEQLMAKGVERTPEEDKLLDLLVAIIRGYESNTRSIPKATPREVLIHLMDNRKLRQSDLVSIIGSRGYVSDVVNGKRGISKDNAKALAEFFHVSPAVFM
jgi:HTH-type transcriptional regulator/antitoxin HigA